jgi:hypothetical protein
MVCACPALIASEKLSCSASHRESSVAIQVRDPFWESARSAELLRADKENDRLAIPRISACNAQMSQRLCSAGLPQALGEDR